MSGNAAALPSGTVLTNAGTVLFNGQYLTAANGTPTFTLGGLTAVAGSAFGFTLNGTGADGLNVANAATVAAGATIGLNISTGVTPTPGTYTLFPDANGGLGNFTLSPNRSFLLANGVSYALSFNASNTADILTIGQGTTARLFFTGAASNSLAPAANYTADAGGTMNRDRGTVDHDGPGLHGHGEHQRGELRHHSRRPDGRQQPGVQLQHAGQHRRARHAHPGRHWPTPSPPAPASSSTPGRRPPRSRPTCSWVRTKRSSTTPPSPPPR